MSRTMFRLSVLCASLTLATALAGCGTSNKEGNVSPGNVAKVSETLCAQCHSASVEALSGDSIYQKYTESLHALNQVGCQDCHGGGAEHNGIGPMPYPKPNYVQCKTCHDSAGLVTAYEGSKHLSAATEDGEKVCNRCHTHQGAVLSAKFHYTGDGNVMEAEVNAPGAITNAEPIKCNTCHVTHKPDELRIDSKWNPSTTVGAPTLLATNADGTVVDNTANGQYRLCTQCHGYINTTGKLMGSGTVASNTDLVGHHETSWYRIIGSTHYDSATVTGDPITGYGVRTTGTDPCFDCHGHESKTNTNSGSATIYTEWAMSGHGGGILTAKKAAATANPVNTSLPRTDPVRVAQGLAQADAVMAASVDPGVWNEHNSAGCNRCHTAPGFVAILATPAGNAQPVLTKGQVLACYACHANPGTGELRTLSGTTFTNYTGRNGWQPIGYTLNYSKKAYPDVKGSNLCIQCHDAREKDPGAITAASTTYQRTHYLQAATTMYVKMGFLNLSTGASGLAADTSATYLKSLKSTQDGGTIRSTHRNLGTPAIIGTDGITAADTAFTSNGPCVTCHYAGGNHTQTIDQRTITAVCNKCHTEEAGHSITTIADFNTYFLEPQSEAYQAALQLAIALFNSRNNGITLAYEPGSTEFVRAYSTATLSGGVAVEGVSTEPTAAQWTAAATGIYSNKMKLLGAVSNVVYLKREPNAFVHARTFSRRLLYDTIDYLDDGSLNMSVGTTATTVAPSTYTKGAAAFNIVNGEPSTLVTGTSEAMVYLLGWSRSTGAWNATERP